MEMKETKKVGREEAGMQQLHPQRLHPLLWRHGCRASLGYAPLCHVQQSLCW